MNGKQQWRFEMDIIGIPRQQGFTTRLAMNIAMHLCKGNTIVGVCQNGMMKNALISKVYAILASVNLSAKLLPTVPTSYYTFYNGGNVEIIEEKHLNRSSFAGKRFDCLFSDPGRFTPGELNLILPNAKLGWIFLDEHNATPSKLVLPSSRPDIDLSQNNVIKSR